jgi:hypothetical protein
MGRIQKAIRMVSRLGINLIARIAWERPMQGGGRMTPPRLARHAGLHGVLRHTRGVRLSRLAAGHQGAGHQVLGSRGRRIYFPRTPVCFASGSPRRANSGSDYA